MKSVVAAAYVYVPVTTVPDDTAVIVSVVPAEPPVPAVNVTVPSDDVIVVPAAMVCALLMVQVPQEPLVVQSVVPSMVEGEQPDSTTERENDKPELTVEPEDTAVMVRVVDEDKPSVPDILMSMRTKSGLSSIASLTASAPSPA
jgi:hypothetical protein